MFKQRVSRAYPLGIYIFGIVKRGAFVTSDWAKSETLGHIFAALTLPNALACEISMSTGARIGDVLAITREQAQIGRWSYREEKTGKRRTIRLTKDQQLRAIAMAGRVFVFEHRLDRLRHRTRQAVWSDVRRSAKLFRMREHVTPHSCRKAWAVSQFRRSGGDLKKVKGLLNHSSEAVTMIYALADQITAARQGGR